MAQVAFTITEFNHLANLAASLMKARKQMTQGEWKKPQHQAVKSFAAKFAAPVAEDELTAIERILTRNDARLIQEACSMSLRILEDNIIPEYQSRIHKEKEKAPLYAPYLEKATQSASVNKSLIEKIEGML